MDLYGMKKLHSSTQVTTKYVDMTTLLLIMCFHHLPTLLQYASPPKLGYSLMSRPLKVNSFLIWNMLDNKWTYQ